MSDFLAAKLKCCQKVSVFLALQETLVFQVSKLQFPSQSDKMKLIRCVSKNKTKKSENFTSHYMRKVVSSKSFHRNFIYFYSRTNKRRRQIKKVLCVAIFIVRCEYTDVKERERETHAHELLSRFMLNLTLTVKYENDEMI